MHKSSIYSECMEYIAALTGRLNVSDSESLVCQSSSLNNKPRLRKPDIDERSASKACPKTFVKTVRFTGRFDGPSETHTEHSQSASGASTLPCRRPKASPRPSLNVLKSGTSSRSTSSVKSPDRFLPQRPVVSSASQSYRVNKDPESLSSHEKLLRNNEASPDAFSTRRSVTAPVPPPNGLVVFPVRRNITANRGGGASVLTLQRDPPSANGERNVSVGTVWTVGGLAPMSVGVSDGRGILLGTGAHPTLYTTSFSTAYAKAEEELGKHEGRLAEALQLDRATRVLEFRRSSISPQKPNMTMKKPDLKEAKTIWKGTEWVMGGSGVKITASTRLQEVCAFTPPWSLLSLMQSPGSNTPRCSIQSPRRPESS